MRDISNPLIKKYYETILATGYPVSEGEEAKDKLNKLYIVISDVTSTDTSTKNSTDVSAQLQVTINSWEVGYNNCKSLNTAAGIILTAIKPTPNAVLDLSADNLQMLNLKVTNDRIQPYGKLDGRVYISRQIIFNQDIFIY